MARIAQIGAGYWGRNLVRNFARLGVLAAVCDPDKDTAAANAKNYPDVKLVSDYSEILAETGIDAVSIATPADTHYKLAKQALFAGKHVFVEKPMALDSAEADELAKTAAEKDLRLMVGHILLYHQGVRYVKGLIDEGALGDVYYFYSQRVNLGRIRSDENALWSLAPHDVAVSLYLLGNEPVSVRAFGKCFIQREAEVEDVAYMTVEFPGRKFASIHVSWLDPHKIRKFTVVGSKKMVVFDDMEATEKVRVYDKGVTGTARQKKAGEYDSYGDSLTLRQGDIVIPKIDVTEPLRVECEHFINCVETGCEPLTGPAHAAASVRVLEAASESLASGGAPVTIKRGGGR